ncbi:DinB family protein [Streptomyces mexicanus]
MSPSKWKRPSRSIRSPRPTPAAKPAAPAASSSSPSPTDRVGRRFGGAPGAPRLAPLPATRAWRWSGGGHPAPSSMTLLGLVQHMAEVERNWFQRVFAGQDVPPVFGEGNADGFALQPVRGLDEAMTVWQAEIARGRELTAGASWDDSGRLSEQEAGHVGDQGVSLRWIMVRMIEEYARHNGHADLIREQIDGVTGA